MTAPLSAVPSPLPPESPQEKLRNAALVLRANRKITLDSAFLPVSALERALTLVDQAIAQLDRAGQHQCQLPESISQALNSGDGVYRP